MNPGRTLSFVAFFLAALAASAGNPSSARADGIDLEIISVLARNQGNALDPRLRGHRSYLVGFPYSSFELLRRQKRHISWGRQVRFNLPGPGEVAVKPQMREKAGVALKVALRGPQKRRLVETHLCLQDHRVLMMGGPRHRDGVLIILVSPIGDREPAGAEPREVAEHRPIR